MYEAFSLITKATTKREIKRVTEYDIEAAQPSRPLKLAFILLCEKVTKCMREDSYHSRNGRPLKPNMEKTK